MLETEASETAGSQHVKKKQHRDITKIVLKRKEHLSLLCEWEQCSNMFSEMMEFIKHVGGHLAGRKLPTVPEGGYLCQWRECENSVSTYEEMNRCPVYNGRNMIPELPDSLQCGWIECEGVYENPEIFYRHVNNHVEVYPQGNNPKVPVTCHWEGCACVVKSKHRLRDHLRSHTQEKLTACPSCGALFSSPTRFIDHLKRQARELLLAYQCSHCAKKFASERLLKDHMRYHVNHYKCPFCDMTCPAPTTLRLHIKYRHTDHKPFACIYCEHCCKSSADLRRHMETHNEGNNYRCDVQDCNYSCRSLQTLNNHNRVKHEGITTPRYLCHVCDKLFTRGQKLTVHLKSQHKFRWPPGHSRFRYQLHTDGYLRLQTVRYESVELTQELIDADNQQGSDASSEAMEEQAGEGMENENVSQSGQERVELAEQKDGNMQQECSYELPSPEASSLCQPIMANLHQVAVLQGQGMSASDQHSAVAADPTYEAPQNPCPVNMPVYCDEGEMGAATCVYVQSDLPTVQDSCLYTETPLATDSMITLSSLNNCFREANESEKEAAYTLLTLPHNAL
ncbi:PREDICTED: histone H4 transcription factor-like isoform X2 [Priapulus caudatus]|uniref:Histone H4 transcription factor-like isoform X2 n=1 Tax=Priapulus caudatus TaxID=37621 RepID=A0ABM1EQ85_PRICU|nr:PREDICTED: histone H4 transcription factor-like isoform X2 [Priapulus caudatus]